MENFFPLRRRLDPTTSLLRANRLEEGVLLTHQHTRSLHVSSFSVLLHPGSLLSLCRTCLDCLGVIMVWTTIGECTVARGTGMMIITGSMGRGNRLSSPFFPLSLLLYYPSSPSPSFFLHLLPTACLPLSVLCQPLFSLTSSCSRTDFHRDDARRSHRGR